MVQLCCRVGLPRRVGIFELGLEFSRGCVSKVESEEALPSGGVVVECTWSSARGDTWIFGQAGSEFGE